MKYYLSQGSDIKIGDGIVNSVINRLPFEVHLPGYNFCGPGTKLQKRLERGDVGVNLLDEACKEHDIAYPNNKELSDRHHADRNLLNKALSRARASDATWKEKLAAVGVAAAMDGKIKLGMGTSYKTMNQPTKNQSSINMTSSTTNIIIRKSAHVMLQSIKLMNNYTKKMESLLNSLTIGEKKTLRKNVRKQQSIPKPKKQLNGNDETIENYHQKLIRQKILNKSNKTKKRKMESEKGLDNIPSKTKRVLEKEFLEEIKQHKPQKRKINEMDLEESYNKKHKFDNMEYLSESGNLKRKFDDSSNSGSDVEDTVLTKKIKTT